MRDDIEDSNLDEGQEVPALNPEQELPSDPAIRKILTDGIDQIVASMARVRGEGDYQKEAIKKLKKETGVPPKTIRKFARWRLSDNSNPQKEAVEVEVKAAAFDILYKGAAPVSFEEPVQSED